MDAPGWHYARNTSWTRKVDHFTFTGCCHVTELVGKAIVFIPQCERAAMEAKWDAHAETLFAAYTAKWDESAREAFRARLWPVPPPVVPTELFTRQDHGEERPTVGDPEDDEKGAF